MPISTKTDTTSLEQFMEKCKKERDETQSTLKEIDLLIQQTTAEVERLAQRNTQATNKLRQIESAMETVPRQDIQETYTTVLDAQQRLFTMRGQLEKLQSDQRNLTCYLDLLRDTIELTGNAESKPSVSEEDETKSLPIIRVIEAQERERQRLSQQMHDGPAQSLTNLILQAEICERLFDTDAERARGELASLKNAVAATFQKVKGFILNLRPMMLDDLGVIPTLRRYVGTFSDNSEAAISLTITGKERRLESYKEVTIFRLIQQLLNNAIEYGQANNIQINLDIGEKVARASVEDNGSGFELTDRLNSADADQLGLSMMRERLEMLNGQINFDSGLGRGTRVSFELPVS